MGMKYLSYICSLLTAMSLLTACQSEEIVEPTSSEEMAEGMMPVRMKFTIPDAVVRTRASFVSGQEQDITNIKMICFNQQDAFVGSYDATLKEDGDGNGYTGIIEGEVSSQTTKVHFVANYPDLVVSQSANYLRDMHDVIQDKVLTLDYNSNKTITYWTYHAEQNPAAMARFLSPKTEDGDKYIHFIRDRVKISSTSIDPAVLADSKIESIDWMVCDGLTKGYVIPWRTFNNGTDFIGTDINKDFFKATVNGEAYGNIKITPYEKNNRERYEATADNENSYFENFQNENGSSLYVFEDWNDGTSDGATPETKNVGMVRLIFRVKYSDESGYRYHVIKMADENSLPYQLKRNHNFQVEIKSLKKNISALNSFESALKSDQFSNDVFASVAEIVPSVSEEKWTLTIDGKTTKELNSKNVTSDLQYTVHFTLLDADGKGVTGSDFLFDGMDANFATVVENSATYDSNTGKGSVTIQLKESIPGSGEEPHRGRLRIFEKTSRLYRYITFYAVEEFVMPSAPTMTGKGPFSLTVTIPGNYPEGLYPVTLVIGTRTLTPTGIVRVADSNGEFDALTLDGAFAVEVESTGTNGWNYQSGSVVWNANAAKWDYVYKFNILEKPINKKSETNEYSTQDAKYTITFRDSRAAINAGNADVGLFFEVENFGHGSQYQIYGQNDSFTTKKSGN